MSDDQGLIEMLTNNINYFRERPDDLPKLTILMDNRYHPATLIKGLEQIYPQIMSKIQYLQDQIQAVGVGIAAGAIVASTSGLILLNLGVCLLKMIGNRLIPL